MNMRLVVASSPSEISVRGQEEVRPLKLVRFGLKTILRLCCPSIAPSFDTLSGMGKLQTEF
jgi:hypothetical protein